jgi:hypothetical protein
MLATSSLLAKVTASAGFLWWRQMSCGPTNFSAVPVDELVEKHAGIAADRCQAGITAL